MSFRFRSDLLKKGRKVEIPSAVCRLCKKTNKASAKFCVHCGDRLGSDFNSTEAECLHADVKALDLIPKIEIRKGSVESVSTNRASSSFRLNEVLELRSKVGMNTFKQHLSSVLEEEDVSTPIDSQINKEEEIENPPPASQDLNKKEKIEDSTLQTIFFLGTYFHDNTKKIKPFDIHYKDADGDLIWVEIDDDWKECIMQFQQQNSTAQSKLQLYLVDIASQECSTLRSSEKNKLKSSTRRLMKEETTTNTLSNEILSGVNYMLPQDKNKIQDRQSVAEQLALQIPVPALTKDWRNEQNNPLPITTSPGVKKNRNKMHDQFGRTVRFLDKPTQSIEQPNHYQENNSSPQHWSNTPIVDLHTVKPLDDTVVVQNINTSHDVGHMGWQQAMDISLHTVKPLDTITQKQGVFSAASQHSDVNNKNLNSYNNNLGVNNNNNLNRHKTWDTNWDMQLKTIKNGMDTIPRANNNNTPATWNQDTIIG